MVRFSLSTQYLYDYLLLSQHIHFIATEKFELELTSQLENFFHLEGSYMSAEQITYKLLINSIINCSQFAQTNDGTKSFGI